jgi:hypothetical protein
MRVKLVLRGMAALMGGAGTVGTLVIIFIAAQHSTTL